MTPYFLNGELSWLSLVHLRKQEKVKRSRVRWHPYASQGWQAAWCCSWAREPEVGLASAPGRWPGLGEGLAYREMVFQRKGFGGKMERNVN